MELGPSNAPNEYHPALEDTMYTQVFVSTDATTQALAGQNVLASRALYQRCKAVSDNPARAVPQGSQNLLKWLRAAALKRASTSAYAISKMLEQDTTAIFYRLAADGLAFLRKEEHYNQAKNSSQRLTDDGVTPENHIYHESYGFALAFPPPQSIDPRFQRKRSTASSTGLLPRTQAFIDAFADINSKSIKALQAILPVDLQVLLSPERLFRCISAQSHSGQEQLPNPHLDYGYPLVLAITLGTAQRTLCLYGSDRTGTTRSTQPKFEVAQGAGFCYVLSPDVVVHGTKIPTTPIQDTKHEGTWRGSSFALICRSVLTTKELTESKICFDGKTFREKWSSAVEKYLPMMILPGESSYISDI
tara:strand:- start:179 stop:1261 length:1083 start_codon:yes stop_codon:yes gene_type:complete